MNNRYLIDKFYKEILQIKNRFEDMGVTPQSVTTAEFRQIINDLKALLSRKEFLSLAEYLQADDKLAKLAEQLREIYNQYYFYSEERIARNLVLHKSQDFFLSNNNRLGDEEVEQAQLDRKSHVFYVGSGPFPWTAIKYAKTKKCLVTCIDSNPTGVAVSRELINTLGLADLIMVWQGWAQEADYSQATHAVIAGMAYPKNAILAQIYRTARRNVKIIVRSSFNLYFFMYPRITQSQLKDFQVNQVIEAGQNSELVSYILSKKE